MLSSHRGGLSYCPFVQDCSTVTALLPAGGVFCTPRGAVKTATHMGQGSLYLRRELAVFLQSGTPHLRVLEIALPSNMRPTVSTPFDGRIWRERRLRAHLVNSNEVVITVEDEVPMAEWHQYIRNIEEARRSPPAWQRRGAVVHANAGVVSPKQVQTLYPLDTNPQAPWSPRFGPEQATPGTDFSAVCTSLDEAFDPFDILSLSPFPEYLREELG
ncbi:hypothetical protein BAUCODRAFT_33020 [Baudoinia panamericana UAMH 10762]|uniref:Uncharacterized protein n=1 Tax=Baudoinia panamericana (strain UAMH 10762) TaxID=717646 RepID=M2LS48_BAUPA|nr:uncharacterized protein BAUCODRAFT_33020 [Baudoinia panamericana UAMH 10762]EMC97292.1 hypothetical protein BAUCODRAFT_33020 [Baudoinia panamericana UAMH 10762]